MYISKLSYHLLHTLRDQLTLFTLFAISGCTSLGGPNASFGNNKTATLIQQSDAYVAELPEVSLSQIARSVTKDIFKSGDIAEIDVYNVDALTNTYVVGRDGNVNFPLIGTCLLYTSPSPRD